MEVRFIFSIDWWLKQCLFTLEYLRCSSTYQFKAYQLCFFTETYWLFLAVTFWSLKNLIIWFTVVLKLAVTVFLDYIFRASDQNDLIFFAILKTFQSYDWRKTSLPVCLKQQVNATHLCQQQTEWSVLGQLHSILVSNSIIKILNSSS